MLSCLAFCILSFFFLPFDYPWRTLLRSPRAQTLRTGLTYAIRNSIPPAKVYNFSFFILSLTLARTIFFRLLFISDNFINTVRLWHQSTFINYYSFLVPVRGERKASISCCVSNSFSSPVWRQKKRERRVRDGRSVNGWGDTKRSQGVKLSKDAFSSNIWNVSIPW